MEKSFLSFYVGLRATDSDLVTAHIPENDWSGFYKRYDIWNREREDNIALGVVDPSPNWSVYGYHQVCEHAKEYARENPSEASRVVIVRVKTFRANWESFSSYVPVTSI